MEKTLEAPGMPSLFLAKSCLSTEGNKTGSWRFLRPRYQEKTAPCSIGCPTGQDIARIEMLTAQGLFKEAWETILYENPFPAVCGRVCYHPCEQFCNRREFDEPLAIHVLERFLADTATRYRLQPSLEKLPAKEEKIAVVGAGPSGLAAAYFLARLGYGVDVFEARSEPGGMLRWGIPPYRLNSAAVKDEIGRILDLGVTIHCNNPISEDFLQKAKGRFHAVFLGCGHWGTPLMKIPGEELDCVIDGLTFLQKIAQGNPPHLKGKVAVLGGGNTAIDVARCALRLGAKVVVFYRRRRQDMPAFEEEVLSALEEGVELQELKMPVSIERKNQTAFLTLQQTRVIGEDDRGRSIVEPEPGKTETIEVNCIFKALGSKPEEHWMTPPSKDFLRFWNTALYSTEGGVPVVLGGDLTNDTKSVVHAVASGKEAAMVLDVLFRDGIEAISPRLQSCQVGGGPPISMEIFMSGSRSERSSRVVRYQEINTDHFHFASRLVQPRLLKNERIRSFDEIDLRISATLAIHEAQRCFNCGICNQCDNCRLFCPDLAVHRDSTAMGRSIDYEYCKGCGICVVECPRNAMILEEELVEGQEDNREEDIL